jgi:hypothetical protein
MKQEKRFLTFAAIAALLTAFTTLGVHFIDFPAPTFEERLLLGRNPWYVGQKWMIVFHCLMVIVSMFGAAWVASRSSPGFAALSALFFSVFGVAEITRMLAVLTWLNPLRERYLLTDDTVLRAALQQQIEIFGGLTGVLFYVFILAFALGNLFMGLALPQDSSPVRWVARGFLLWAALSFLAFGNSFWSVAAFTPLIEANNHFFQPAFRAVIAWWLWKNSSPVAKVIFDEKAP